MIYLLDMNAIADRIYDIPSVIERFERAIEAGDSIGLCEPVHYEVLRGLLWKQETAKRSIYEEQFVPALDNIPLLLEDWEQAAQFWAETRRRGKQFSDVDLLLAALVMRLNAIIVSADNDFDALPIRRENWRQ